MEIFFGWNNFFPFLKCCEMLGVSNNRYFLMVTERLLTPMTIFYEAKKLKTTLQV